MSLALILIGGLAPLSPMSWVCVNTSGQIAQRGEGGAPPPSGFPGARTALVVPGADARLQRLELPARTDAQARAGAAALFDGALAGGSEDIHYAVGAAQDGAGRRLAAAISKVRLNQWLDRCRLLGLDPHRIVLDCTVWPHIQAEIVIASLPDRVIVCGGDRGGLSIEHAIAPAVISRWLSAASAQGARIVLQGDGAYLCSQTFASNAVSEPLPDPLRAMALGAVHLSSHAPNLRQGEFAPEGREREPFKLWRFAALLLMAAAMLQAGSQLISGWRDNQAAAQILAQAEHDLREARPDVRRIVNLRAQATALANALEQSGRHPIIVTAAPVTEALRQHPLARVDEVRHSAPGRSVRMIISAGDPQDLEALASALRERNIDAEAQTVQPRDGRYVIELIVEAP